jgi:hypothetical protein
MWAFRKLTGEAGARRPAFLVHNVNQLNFRLAGQPARTAL